jgi:hypothetical protein
LMDVVGGVFALLFSYESIHNKSLKLWTQKVSNNPLFSGFVAFQIKQSRGRNPVEHL